MKYKVTTLRAAGLEARWTKTRNGSPVIVARNPKATSEHQRKTWYSVDAPMWRRAETVGIVEAFNEHTLLGDIFSVAL